MLHSKAIGTSARGFSIFENKIHHRLIIDEWHLKSIWAQNLKNRWHAIQIQLQIVQIETNIHKCGSDFQ